MKRGEVWWANLPAPSGRRPVLIITRSSAVAVRAQLVAAQITRTVHSINAEVPLSRADGMPQDCVVNWRCSVYCPEVTNAAAHHATLRAEADRRRCGTPFRSRTHLATD